MGVGGALCRRLCAALLLAAALAPGSASAATPDDARTVVCLSASGRQGVVEAGAALGLVTSASTPAAVDQAGGGTKTLTLEAWRKARPADFRRACAAHVEAQALTRGNPPASASSTPGWLSWLPPLVVGALLTMGAAEIRSARDRGLANANGIRTATAAFRDAVSAYAAGWAETTVGASPSPAEVDTTRRNLVAVLRRATAGRDSWQFAKRLVNDLDSPRYRAQLKEGWAADRANGRLPDRVEHVGELLGALESDTERIALAADGLTYLRRRPMRKEDPTSPLCPVL
ncbi:hypothetical protein [Streptomyces genisteinicus]|uniref:Uncharacterized protein n=1 Tax=Streptomyces genisteinicus TaxID=2768068 RepID=A0A7H0HLR2_9ACTN|nr:hypothetical protein [Streptomyces genisteinicus]QNP61478.1 hypothetical protein IAG43_00115 [Streptomyces genisteinicus]